MENSLTKEYFNHKVFNQIKEYADFYQSLSFSIINWISQGTNSLINIDTYIFSSIHGTLDSILDILIKGRINDSYALLRKYYDAAIINLYSNLYCCDNFSIEKQIVEKINNWVKGKEEIPSFRKMSDYIIKSDRVIELTKLIYNKGFSGSSLEKIRERCNHHTHYLYYHNLLLNDNSVYLPNRLSILDSFSEDLKQIFILHFSYLFYLNEHYMMSSDYRDGLDVGMIPEEDSQYWVAPFIQKMFNEVIRTDRPDIAEMIRKKTIMKLE